jgi:hypothetical protein
MLGGQGIGIQKKYQNTIKFHSFLKGSGYVSIIQLAACYFLVNL